MEEVIYDENLPDSSCQLQQKIPDGYIRLPHQVGGCCHVKDQLRFLRHNSQLHILYKLVTFKPKGKNEVSFYDALHDVKSSVGDPSRFPRLCRDKGTNSFLYSITPKYYGLTSIADKEGKSNDYLILEDITFNFSHPCILDLKIGQFLWNDFDSDDKKARKRKKYPNQVSVGFSVMGMRIYRKCTDEYVLYNEDFGRFITETNIVYFVSQFFEVGDGTYRIDIIDGLLSQLSVIIEWMEQQYYLSLSGTSLLIVYEGGHTPHLEEKQCHFDIRLIDFGQVYEKHTNGPDHSTLYSLRRFAKVLREIRDNIV